MRIEQFMPGPEFNQTEWYVACAQIEIVGPGGGKPEGFVRFPGAYPDPYSPSQSKLSRYLFGKEAANSIQVSGSMMKTGDGRRT
jgi:hypothetical protein